MDIRLLSAFVVAIALSAVAAAQDPPSAPPAGQNPGQSSGQGNGGGNGQRGGRGGYGGMMGRGMMGTVTEVPRTTIPSRRMPARCTTFISPPIPES